MRGVLSCAVLLLTVLVLRADSRQTSVFFSSDSLIQQQKIRIDSAQHSIDICFYDLDSSYITSALRQARRRGVRVRVITDYPFDASDLAAIESLRRDGIPVFSDSAKAASYEMHNKFAVFDYTDTAAAAWVWTGSYNVTVGTMHADNVILIRDTGLARSYTQEFNQMWGSTESLPNFGNARFHNQKSDVLARHWFVVGTDTFRLYCGPQNRLMDTLSQLVNRAQEEVGFAVYSFSQNTSNIAANMIRRHRAGVWVGGVFDRTLAGLPSSAYHMLRDSGLPVLRSNLPPGYSLLHEKIMVIDRRIVVTGSANWSDNVNNGNDENLLIIHSPDIARRYLVELSRRYGEAGGSYPVRWSGLADIPIGPRYRRIRDGCALAEAEPGGRIGLLKGNNTCEFYCFDPATNEWLTGPMIPELGRTGRIRRVRKGAFLAASRGQLYAGKGGNSLEFWRYDPTRTPEWAQLADIPAGTAGLRNGSGAVGISALGSTFIYLLKASGTCEFYRYYGPADIWERLPDAPAGETGKRFGAGSSLAFDGMNRIYALKGKENEFYVFDVSTGSWTPLAGLPFVGRSGRRRAAGAGAGIVACGSTVYAVKGGNSLEFWRYDCGRNEWSQEADVPSGSGRKVRGGALAAALRDGILYLVKGNNTLEFYSYGPVPVAAVQQSLPEVRSGSEAGRKSELLRVGADNIEFSLSENSEISLRLFDSAGRLQAVLATGYHPAGRHRLPLTSHRIAQGVYLLALQTRTGLQTLKLIVP